MQHVVIVIHLMLVLALIGVVLLQRSEGGGLGIGVDGGGFMTSRGTANVLTRATAILAGLFFVTSLMLSILAGMNRKPTSILQDGRRARRRHRARRAAAAGAGRGLLNNLQARRAGGARGPGTCAGRALGAGRCRSRNESNRKGRETGPFGVRGMERAERAESES